MDWYGQHAGIVNNNPSLSCHSGVFSSHFDLAPRTEDNYMGGARTSNGDTYCGITFNANAANPIYGNSNTVTPASLKVGMYIKF